MKKNLSISKTILIIVGLLILSALANILAFVAGQNSRMDDNQKITKKVIILEDVINRNADTGSFDELVDSLSANGYYE